MKKRKEIQDLIDDMRQERKGNKDILNEEKQKIFHERMSRLLEQYGIIQNRTLTSFKTEIANRIYTTDRMVSNYILGKAPCPPAALIAIADYFSTRADKDGNINIISVDYLLGRTDHTSLGNEYIYDVTGLSDKAIDKLRRMNTMDRAFRYYVTKGAPAWNSIFMALKLPVINALITSKKFVDFLDAFKRYTWSDSHYNLAMKQDEKYYGIDGQLVLFAEDPEDNIAVDVNTSFIKAVAKNQMDIDLDSMSRSCNKNKEIFAEWYAPIYAAETLKKNDKKQKK